MNDKLPSPDALLLHRIRWDYFVTLTHAPQGSPLVNPKIQIQSKRWHKYVRIICRTLKQHPRNVLWIKRWEVGRGGRDHFHVLMRLPSRCRRSVKSCVYRLENIWKSKLEYGIADVRSIQGEDSIAGYIAKAVNDYEANRFSNERYRSVMFSSAAIRAMT